MIQRHVLLVDINTFMPLLYIQKKRKEKTQKKGRKNFRSQKKRDRKERKKIGKIVEILTCEKRKKKILFGNGNYFDILFQHIQQKQKKKKYFGFFSFFVK